MIIFFILINPLLPIQSAKGIYLEGDDQKSINQTIFFPDLSDLCIQSDTKKNNETIVPTSNGELLVQPLTKTIILPRNSIITNISYSFNSIHELSLNNTRSLYSTPVRYSTNRQLLETSTIHPIAHETPYINQSCTYSIGCGISNGEPALFITLKCNPISYQPTSDKISIAQSMNYSITYELTDQRHTSPTSYDMVIISPRLFKNSLKPLVNHKNDIGISTFIKPTQEIYQEYNGRDDAEDIKLFIKDAIEQWNIKYVLLVGGHVGQTKKWHVPVRYSNLHDRSFWNDSYVTDLYFSDIYRYNSSKQTYEFDDWDSNQNNIFAEWTWIYDHDRGWWYDQDKKDNLDLYPDVLIGRLACRDKKEVRHVVKKIIHYETNTYNKEWFKTAILCGGDTVPYSDGICEGEIENEFAASYLEPLGFETKKLWVSTGTLKGPFDVIKEMRKGAGFLYLSGHGTPREWCTHPVSDGYNWTDLYRFETNLFNNNYKFPIGVVGGCHNSQFDVSLSNIPRDFLRYGLSYFTWNEGIECFFKWTWVSNSWSWNLVSQKNEGCIAVIGNTGLGWGVGGERCTEYNEGYLTSRFFKHYSELSQQGIHQLGTVHQETLNNYISHFQANNDLLDRKTVEEWVLLGDPSLCIGGYPSS